MADDDKTTTRMVTMRLDETLVDRLREIAEEEDRTFTAQVQRILRAWLADHDKTEARKR